MRRFLYLSVILAFSIISSVAQTDTHRQIREVVRECISGIPIPDVILTFHQVAANDSVGKLIAFTTSQSDGTFSVMLHHKEERLICKAKLLGYKVLQMEVSIHSDAPLTLLMAENTDTLPEVTVLGSPIRSRGDTITYQASAFVTPDTYSAEDLIRRLPGITVDPQGLIKYLGESIQGVYIEGLDLVAKNYRTATQIIKADDIKEIDVMEHFQPIKILRGIREKDGAMLNIKLKDPNMLTPSGDAAIARGAMDKKQLVYDARLNALLVNARMQILSALGIGNANQPIPQDLTKGQEIPHSSARSLIGESLGGTAPPYATSRKSQGGTVNHLIKLKNDTSIKYNMGYNHQSQRTENGQSGKLFNGFDYTPYEEENTYQTTIK